MKKNKRITRKRSIKRRISKKVVKRRTGGTYSQVFRDLMKKKVYDDQKQNRMHQAFFTQPYRKSQEVLVNIPKGAQDFLNFL